MSTQETKKNNYDLRKQLVFPKVLNGSTTPIKDIEDAVTIRNALPGVRCSLNSFMTDTSHRAALVIIADHKKKKR